MFVLSVLEDEVALPASRLQRGRHLAEVRAQLEAKFVDRVVTRLGLVVALYDILSVRDAFVFPGDFKDSQGEAACTAVFRLVVFRPTIGEVLLGRVSRSSTAGLSVSVAGLVEVDVPARFLKQPAVFDERSRTWVWQFQTPEGKKSNLFYDIGDEVACTVSSFHAGEEQNPLLLVGAMDQTGTGPLKWWI